jgi:hypothetical protein
MATKKKAVAAAPPMSREELESVVREAIRTGVALKSTDLKKALPKANRSQDATALAIAQELARRGEIHRWAKAKAEWFFGADPIATLDEAVPRALAAGPLPAETLQQRITLETMIPKACFDEWKKNALARGALFAVAPAAGAGTKASAKNLALEPDLRVVLKGLIAALHKQLPALDAKGIARERIAQVLWEELGMPGASAPNGRDDRDAFLKALRALASEQPHGTLLPVGDLRSRLALDKTRFDEAALSLSREGAVILHHHDYADGLAVDERERLVRDANGTYYVGIALKSV